jgi:hypothetical protein
MDSLLFAGIAVRDQSGRTGRVVGSMPGEMTVGWETGALERHEEKIPLTDGRLRWEIECLTLDRGWVPVQVFLDVGQPRTRVRESVELPSELRGLIDEATKHYPFTFKAVLGPGPRGRTFRERLMWACRCANYTCTCRGKGGRTKTVRIDPAYKAAYNAQYKAWRAQRST